MVFCWLFGLVGLRWRRVEYPWCCKIGAGYLRIPGSLHNPDKPVADSTYYRITNIRLLPPHNFSHCCLVDSKVEEEVDEEVDEEGDKEGDEEGDK